MSINRLLATAAFVVVAMVASGCGGSPAEEESGDASTSGPTASADGGDTPDGDTFSDGQVPESLNFTGTTVEGDEFDAATLAGKPVVLWFWAPWCPKCKASADDVAAAAGANPDVAVVGVAGLDDSIESMSGFISENGVSGLTHLADPDGTIWKKFEITSQSTYALIDAEGTVTYTGSIDDGELSDRFAELAA